MKNKIKDENEVSIRVIARHSLLGLHSRYGLNFKSIMAGVWLVEFAVKSVLLQQVYLFQLVFFYF